MNPWLNWAENYLSTQQGISLFSRHVCAYNWLNANCFSVTTNIKSLTDLTETKYTSQLKNPTPLHYSPDCPVSLPLCINDFNWLPKSYVSNEFRTLEWVIDHIPACISVKCINMNHQAQQIACPHSCVCCVSSRCQHQSQRWGAVINHTPPLHMRFHITRLPQGHTLLPED